MKSKDTFFNTLLKHSTNFEEFVKNFKTTCGNYVNPEFDITLKKLIIEHEEMSIDLTSKCLSFFNQIEEIRKNIFMDFATKMVTGQIKPTTINFVNGKPVTING